MPAPERNRWAEWWGIAKERSESARVGFNEWCQACREEPSLIWATPAVRYTTYVIAGLIAALVIRAVVEMIQPVPTSEMTPRARTAHFDVICTNPECGRHFVIDRKFGYDSFPVTCPYCKQKTGYHALRCNSERCRGRLVPTIEVDGEFRCPICGEPIGER